MAYVDDIAIQGASLNIIQEAYNFIQEEFHKLNLKINANKCELISDNKNEFITTKTNGIEELIKTVERAKYLGQTIDENGNSSDLITYGKVLSINSLFENSAHFLTRNSRRKIFHIFLKSKINHLLPLLIINDKTEEIYKELKRVIFRWLLKYDTTPREARELVKCSFFSIIIKPMMRIIERDININTGNEDRKNFIYETIRKAMNTWKKEEPNLDKEIVNVINSIIIDSKREHINKLDVGIWTKKINENAIERLFKGVEKPKSFHKLSKLKELNIIELLSNAPTHIMAELYNNYKQGKIDKDSTKIKIIKELTPYIVINEIKPDNLPNEIELGTISINEIIFQKQIEEVKLEITLDQIIEKTESEADKLVEDTLKNKKYKEDVWLTRFPQIEKKIKIAKEKICELTENQRKKIETMLELLERKSYYEREKIKKPVGRPKKLKDDDKNKNNMDIRKYMKNE